MNETVNVMASFQRDLEEAVKAIRMGMWPDTEEGRKAAADLVGSVEAKARAAAIEIEEMEG